MEPIIIDLVQNSKEWKEFRKMRLGASDTASILGIDPWTTRLMRWEEKVKGTEKKDNEAMARGREKEGACRDLFSKDTGLEFEPITFQHPLFTFMHASCDGAYKCDRAGWILCEIKTPGKKSYDMMIEHGVPEYYNAQCQKQMLVTGSKQVYFLIFDGEKKYTEIVVARDENFIEKIIREESLFYESLINFIPPLPTEKDWVSFYDEDLIFKSERYKQLSNLIDELEMERCKIKIDLTEDLSNPRVRLGDFKIQRVISKGRVDYEKLAKDYQIDDESLDVYRKKPTESWRITIS